MSCATSWFSVSWRRQSPQTHPRRGSRTSCSRPVRSWTPRWRTTSRSGGLLNRRGRDCGRRPDVEPLIGSQTPGVSLKKGGGQAWVVSGRLLLMHLLEGGRATPGGAEGRRSRRTRACRCTTDRQHAETSAQHHPFVRGRTHHCESQEPAGSGPSPVAPTLVPSSGTSAPVFGRISERPPPLQVNDVQLVWRPRSRAHL